MGLLDQLMAGGADRDRYDDFARRYDQGRPHEGYDDDEVAGHYGRLQGDLDDDTYESSAREAYSRMDPDERRQFKKQLHHAARERGHADLDGDGIPDDPESMARYTNTVRRRDPDLLTSMLGGGGMGGGGWAAAWAAWVAPERSARCSAAPWAVGWAAAGAAAAATRWPARRSPASPRWPSRR
jgi:hypothetical protein